MTPQTIVIATCAEWPHLLASDTALADELGRRGHNVTAHAWNDSRIDNFTSADMVVLRSTWDYHHDLESFDNWLTQVDHSGAELHNPADLVREHLHKSYVAGLNERGFPTPATLVMDTFDQATIRSWMRARDLGTVVLKPAWGASGHRVTRAALSELADAQAQWDADPDPRGLVVQQFLPEIHAGEYVLVFFGNAFSHALLRQPAGDDFRVNSQYGGQMKYASDVDPAAIAVASEVLAALSVPPTYARVDIVMSGAGPILMEVEIHEPDLGLHLAPGSAARFADVLLSE